MFYTLFKAFFRVVYSTIFPCRVRGLNNIPKDGPLIICSNHINWADPTLVASMVPGKPVHFMAKEELFHHFLLGPLVKRLKAFPVKRDRADLKTIKTSLSLLKQGFFVGMFPEGTRSRTGRIGEALPGAALIALKSRAPVLPVAIKGPYRPFRRMHMNIGPPLTLEAYHQGKARGDLLKQMSQEIIAEIRRLHQQA